MFFIAFIFAFVMAIFGQTMTIVEQNMPKEQVIRSTIVEKFVEDGQHYLRLYDGEEILITEENLAVWEQLQPGNLVKVDFVVSNDGVITATSLERMIITPPNIECGNLPKSSCSK